MAAKADSSENVVNVYKSNRRSSLGRLSEVFPVVGRRKSKRLSVLGLMELHPNVSVKLPTDHILNDMVENCFQNTIEKVTGEFMNMDCSKKQKIVATGIETCQEFVKLYESSDILKKLEPPEQILTPEAERELSIEMDKCESYTQRLEQEGKLWNKTLKSEQMELFKIQKKLKNMATIELIEPSVKPRANYNAINDAVNQMRRKLALNLNNFNEATFVLESKNSEDEKRLEFNAELIRETCEMTTNVDFNPKDVIDKLSEFKPTL